MFVLATFFAKPCDVLRLYGGVGSLCQNKYKKYKLKGGTRNFITFT